jgi:chromosome segregation ATPase
LDYEQTSTLQEEITQLRSKLEESENDLREFKHNDEHYKKVVAEVQKSRDIDVLSLQHELNNCKKRLVDQRKLCDEMEDKYKTLSRSHTELISSAQALGTDLETERNVSMELMNKLKSAQVDSDGRKELQIIIEDLQKEKSLVEAELTEMINMKFSTSKDDEYNLQISTLKNRIAELQTAHAIILNEKVSYHSNLENYKEQLLNMTNEKRLADVRCYELENDLEQLRNRFKNYEGVLSLDDYEEAKALFQLKREAGVTLEFLSNIGDITGDKQKIKDLKQQYASCVEDINKTTQLLKLQEEINECYKNEVKEINQKMKLIQNEYEFRLEEFSRLLG